MLVTGFARSPLLPAGIERDTPVYAGWSITRASPSPVQVPVTQNRQHGFELLASAN